MPSCATRATSRRRSSAGPPVRSRRPRIRSRRARAARGVTTHTSTLDQRLPSGQLLARLPARRRPRLSARARSPGRRASRSQGPDTSTHDLGFMLFDRFGNGLPAHRHAGLPAGRARRRRRRWRRATARPWARSGRGTRRADFRVIVDNMMNLELLLWGARNGGQPAWRDMAVEPRAAHAAQTTCAPDGSTYHVVDYDQRDGRRQAQADASRATPTESTWARGQAWAVHGFTMTVPRDGRHAVPRHGAAHGRLVPRPPARRPGPVLGLQRARDPERAARHLGRRDRRVRAAGARAPRAGRRPARRATGDAASVLLSLTGPAYLAEGTRSAAVLLHGTYNKPAATTSTPGSSGATTTCSRRCCAAAAAATPGRTAGRRRERER